MASRQVQQRPLAGQAEEGHGQPLWMSLQGGAHGLQVGLFDVRVERGEGRGVVVVEGAWSGRHGVFVRKRVGRSAAKVELHAVRCP